MYNKKDVEMKPCDCESEIDFAKLNEQSIAFNEWSIVPQVMRVDIRGPGFMISIPKHHFKRFAKWYLADQAQFKECSSCELAPIGNQCIYCPYYISKYGR